VRGVGYTFTADVERQGSAKGLLAALRGRQQSFCLRRFLGFDPVLGFDRFGPLLLVLLLLTFDAQDVIENGGGRVLLFNARRFRLDVVFSSDGLSSNCFLVH
jgi:hypothetical protein